MFDAPLKPLVVFDRNQICEYTVSPGERGTFERDIEPMPAEEATPEKIGSPAASSVLPKSWTVAGSLTVMASHQRSSASPPKRHVTVWPFNATSGVTSRSGGCVGTICRGSGFELALAFVTTTASGPSWVICGMTM